MVKLFCGSCTLDLSTPAVMGILNLTPDSFYDGGRFTALDSQVEHAGRMVGDGASIIDIGAVSSRPGAVVAGEEEEKERILPALRVLRKTFPGIALSVDTFRPGVARAAVGEGADIINDIFGGRYGGDMIGTVASLKVPYILMHMKGTPETMQSNPAYSDVVAEVTYFFEQQVARCREAGISQVVIDPGFGFGKTVMHNYTLLSRLDEFGSFNLPVLAGLSRKSMINTVLQTKPGTALNGTTVLNTIALMKGANILRVHDVKEAFEAVRLVKMVE